MAIIDLEALVRVTAPGYSDDAPGGVDVVVGSVDTPVGRLTLAVSPRGLLACSYEEENTVIRRVSAQVSQRVGRDGRALDPVRRELAAYFAARLRAFTTPVDLRLATPFGRAVLQALREVPYGATITYAQLATRIGRPRAARAVGNALATNPVCVVVPCHRVVAADGDLGGYAGGVAAKRLLLDLESAALTGAPRGSSRRSPRWRPPRPGTR